MKEETVKVLNDVLENRKQLRGDYIAMAMAVLVMITVKVIYNIKDWQMQWLGN